MSATLRLVARWGPRPENRRPARLLGHSERLLIEAFDRATNELIPASGLTVSVRRPQGQIAIYEQAQLTAGGTGRWHLDVVLTQPGPWIADVSCTDPQPGRGRAAVDCLPPDLPAPRPAPTFDDDDITMDMD